MPLSVWSHSLFLCLPSGSLDAASQTNLRWGVISLVGQTPFQNTKFGSRRGQKHRFCTQRNQTWPENSVLTSIWTVGSLVGTSHHCFQGVEPDSYAKKTLLIRCPKQLRPLKKTCGCLRAFLLVGEKRCLSWWRLQFQYFLNSPQRYWLISPFLWTLDNSSRVYKWISCLKFGCISQKTCFRM